MAKIINITPSSSKEGLYEKLIEISRSHAETLTRFAGRIIDFALKNKKIFDKPLKSPLRPEGQPFTISLDIEGKKNFKQWAAEMGRTQSGHAVFILEMYLMELADKYYDLGRRYDPGIDLTEEPPNRQSAPLTQAEDPILNIYFDPQLLSKEDISEVLIALNDVYRAMGGKELVVIDEQVGEFNYEPKNELV